VRQPFTIIDAPQRSPEWFQARVGRMTGSRASDMLATLKTGKGEAAGRRNLRADLVLERLTGKPQEKTFQSPAMLDGIEREAEAYGTYEALTGQILTRTGFLRHDALMTGASLDGHEGDFDGLIEIKCPIAATHLDYIESGIVPGNYLAQVTHALWLTGAAWCDWMSFHPDFPLSMRTKIVRIERDERLIAAYEQELLTFLAEVDRKLDSLLAAEVA